MVTMKIDEVINEIGELHKLMHKVPSRSQWIHALQQCDNVTEIYINNHMFTSLPHDVPEDAGLHRVLEMVAAFVSQRPTNIDDLFYKNVDSIDKLLSGYYAFKINFKINRTDQPTDIKSSIDFIIESRRKSYNISGKSVIDNLLVEIAKKVDKPSVVLMVMTDRALMMKHSVVLMQLLEQNKARVLYAIGNSSGHTKEPTAVVVLTANLVSAQKIVDKSILLLATSFLFILITIKLKYFGVLLLVFISLFEVYLALTTNLAKIKQKIITKAYLAVKD